MEEVGDSSNDAAWNKSFKDEKSGCCSVCADPVPPACFSSRLYQGMASKFDEQTKKLS
jgi:hypothetical protein